MSKYERWLATMIAGPVFGMFSPPAMSKRAKRISSGRAVEPQQIGGLEPRDLRYARGHVELQHWPAPHGGEEMQPRVGVDGVRVPNR